MRRLIDADTLTEHMRKAYEGNTKAGFKWDLISTVAVIGAEEEITTNAEPIRHGHWITREVAKDIYLCRCSICKWHEEVFKADEYHYCPNCGAKMDEVEE